MKGKMKGERKKERGKITYQVEKKEIVVIN